MGHGTLCVIGILPRRVVTTGGVQWQTTWDRSQLFTYQKISPPINFTSPSGKGSADIVVNDGSTFQSVWGFGGSLSWSLSLPMLCCSIDAIYSRLFGANPQQLESELLLRPFIL